MNDVVLLVSTGGIVKGGCNVAVVVAVSVLAAGCATATGGARPQAAPAATSSASRTSSPVSPPRRLAAAGSLGSLRADVDGDGRDDRARLRISGKTAWGGLQDMLVVDTAAGAHLRLSISDPGGFYEGKPAPLDRLLGAYDVDGNGRSDLVVFLSGNTLFSAGLVTLVARRLVQVRPDDVIRFGAHGQACGLCTVDTTCQSWHGQPRVVETESQALSSHRRRWQATIYALRGARLVWVAEERGVVATGAALPSSLRFADELDCGTARWSLGG